MTAIEQRSGRPIAAALAALGILALPKCAVCVAGWIVALAGLRTVGRELCGAGPEAVWETGGAPGVLGLALLSAAIWRARRRARA